MFCLNLITFFNKTSTNYQYVQDSLHLPEVFKNSIITYNVVSFTTLCITFCYINTNLYSAFFTESYFVVHKYDFGEVLFLNNIIGNINTNDFKFFLWGKGEVLIFI